MRSMPWRCTIGSATPSSLTRLRSVVEVLLDRVVLPLADLRVGQHAHDRPESPTSRDRVGQVGQRLRSDRPGPRRRSAPAGSTTAAGVRPHAASAKPATSLNGDLLGPSARDGNPARSLEQLGHGAVHVDLVEQVQAAAQVEAERHRPQPDRPRTQSAPATRTTARSRTAPQRLVDASRALQLVRHVVEVQHQPPVVDVAARERDLRSFRRSSTAAPGRRPPRGPCGRPAARRPRRTRSAAANTKARRARPRRRRISSARYSSIVVSGALQRALRHQRGDLELLDLDAHAVGDLERGEAVTRLRRRGRGCRRP
jgi:hypothetical protein